MMDVGMEKFIRLYDVGDYDKPPIEYPILSSGIQKLLWTANDTILLCTCLDTKGILYETDPLPALP